MKRMISLLLAIALVITLFPALPLRAQAKTGGKLVALTFDDGPSSKYTTQLLDGLKERGVPVTFFFLGEMAEDNRAIVRRAYEEGHEIACHTWDHPNLTKCSTSKVKKQIEDTFEELDRACGNEADYLVRPPYGSTNQKVRDAIDAPLIYWSVDSEDWSLLNVEKVRKKIVATPTTVPSSSATTSTRPPSPPLWVPSMTCWKRATNSSPSASCTAAGAGSWRITSFTTIPTRTASTTVPSPLPRSALPAIPRVPTP